MPPASSRRLWRPRRSAVLIGLAVAAFGLGAAHLQTHAASLPTPAIAPANASGSWLSPTIAAGTTWRGGVVVTNTATVARRLRLYAVDAAVVDGGAFAPAAEGGRQGAGSWISPGARRLRLAPGGSRRVGVVIRVPAATKPGVHLAALVVQDASGRPPAGGVRVVDRGALRVYVTVTAAGSLVGPRRVASTRAHTHAVRSLWGAPATVVRRAAL